MSDDLQRLKEVLLTGQRLSMQSSYDRRQPDKKALPHLREARSGLGAFVRAHPDAAEAWLSLSVAEECLLNYPAARRYLERYLALRGDRSKKVLKRLVLLKEYERKWAGLMINPEQLESLGAFLEVELERTACDHSFRLTEDWLNQFFKPKAKQILEAFEKYGGYCDCEVLANVV
ncbi:MAG: DUF2695 domain-containing protein [Candidatus Obscuribacterales bacterium]